MTNTPQGDDMTDSETLAADKLAGVARLVAEAQAHTLRDAKPGDVFRDNEGDTWTRTETGARVEFTGPDSDHGAEPVEVRKRDLTRRVVSQFGPFTPLVPS